MANRLDYFFRQRVTEAELDLGFAQLEQADRNLAMDVGIFGIIDGMIVTERAGVPDVSVELTAPGRAYDQLGQRIFYGSVQTVELSVDSSGVPTAVQTAGSERIVSLFIKFDRLLSEPRTDGNSQQVFFRRDESFRFVVRQGAEAPAGSAVPPPLQPDEILIVDVVRRFGQAQIFNSDLSPNPLVPGDVGRRQRFVFAEASSIRVFSGGFAILAPDTDDVQAVLEAADSELGGHFAGTARRHATPAIDAASVPGTPNSLSAGTAASQLQELLAHLNDHENAPSGAHAASAISYAGGGAWADGATNPATSVAGQLDKILSDLSGALGAARIGIAAVSGTPNALAAGSVRTQIEALLAHLNDHENAASGAHAASAISYTGGGAWADGTTNPATSVQGQLSKIMADLAASNGAARIGVGAALGTPHSLTAGSTASQLAALLGFLNSHVAAASNAHPASALSYAAGPAWLGGRTNPATSVQGQLDKLVVDLGAQDTADDGAMRIGARAVAGTRATLPAGSARTQLDALLGFVDRAGFLDAVNTWASTQTYRGPTSGTGPALNFDITPVGRRLAFELRGTDYPMRLYHAERQLEVTLNARWNGSAWERDNNGYYSTRLILGRNDVRIQQVTTAIPVPFNETEWSGVNARAFGLDLGTISFGDHFISGREREVPSGPLTGYSAAEGEWGSTNANIGGGASFASGRLPAAPSSVTFTVKQQQGTDSSPTAFASDRNGLAWFDSTTGTLPATRYMALTFSAT